MNSEFNKRYYELISEGSSFISNCSNHKKELFGETDMKKVAEAIGDLHYETLAELLDKLSDKLFLDAANDRASGKKAIVSILEHAASFIHEAHIFIEHAWQISKPHMTKEN